MKIYELTEKKQIYFYLLNPEDVLADEDLKKSKKLRPELVKNYPKQVNPEAIKCQNDIYNEKSDFMKILAFIDNDLIPSTLLMMENMDFMPLEPWEISKV